MRKVLPLVAQPALSQALKDILASAAVEHMPKHMINLVAAALTDLGSLGCFRAGFGNSRGRGPSRPPAAEREGYAFLKEPSYDILGSGPTSTNLRTVGTLR